MSGQCAHSHNQQDHHIHLSTETIKRTALTLERVDHIQTRYRLSLRVLSVGNSIADDAFEEGLKDTASFFVDHYDAYTLAPSRERDPARQRKERERKAGWIRVRAREGLLAEIRLTPPRRARRRMAGLVIPWMLSRRILR